MAQYPILIDKDKELPKWQDTLRHCDDLDETILLIPCGWESGRLQLEQRFSYGEHKEENRCSPCGFSLFRPSPTPSAPYKWYQFPTYLQDDL